jgi:RimJ/RimL family protein N-acetyltransferase
LDVIMEAVLPDVPEPTRRLSFRRWHESDAPVILDMYSRREVYRFLGSAPRPVHDLDEALSRVEMRNERTHGLDGIWAIVRSADDAVIGTVLLVPLTRTDGAPTDVYEIGWHLHPDAWGSGFATEAAGAVIARARDGALTQVRAVVFAENAASHAVCRRLGMTQLGLTDEWYDAELVEYRLDLARDDTTVTRLTVDDWQVLRDVRLAALADSPEAFAADLAAERSVAEEQWRARLGADTWAVARRGGASVGLLGVSEPAPRDAADGWIHGWWISPQARGTGAARPMLDWALGVGRQRGWSRIGLGVWAENTEAIAAFTALGFVGQDPRPSSRHAGRTYVPMVRDIG